MMPGVTHLPWASMMRASAGAVRPLPIDCICPLLINTSAPSRRSPVPVRTVAPWISTGGLTGT